MKAWDIINLAFALVLAALSKKFEDSPDLATWLFVAACLPFALLLRNTLLAVKRFLPSIIVTQTAARHFLAKTYEDAANRGGRLLVTHIRPSYVPPSEDIAVKYLTNVKQPLDYGRFLFVEDQQVEDMYARNTLGQLHALVSVTVYSIRAYPLLPTPLWRIVPRVNLLLYYDGKHHTCLLGLDRLSVAGGGNSETNYALVLHDKKSFQVLEQYYHAIAGSKRWVDTDTSLTEYERERRAKSEQASVQSVVLSLWQACEADTTGKIVLCGLFGRRALECSGIVPVDLAKEYEADLDVLIVVEQGSKEVVREYIGGCLSNRSDTVVVWGDDDEYFYYFRHEDRLTVDIELVESGSDFYHVHPLLGRSIFAFFLAIHRRDSDSAIESLVRLPEATMSRKQRMAVLLADRKGLREFMERLGGETHEIDPRRILSQVIKNLAWAATGTRLAEPEGAREAIRNDELMKGFSHEIEDAIRFVAKPRQEACKAHTAGIEISRQLLRAAIEACSSVEAAQ